MKRESKAVWILLLLLGVGIMLYPTVANLWNSKAQAQSIETYIAHFEGLDEAEKKRLWENAKEYNTKIQTGENPLFLKEELQSEYEKTLIIDGSGIIANISIPALDLRLPIYHDTSAAVLQAGVGHIPWSSLPIGGAGTHCVLSGHNGLPSSELFSGIPSLVPGDIFVIEILGEKLQYQVYETETVLPNETDDLRIIPGKDLCTLVTCVPYGINSHRLLVHGERYSPDTMGDMLLIYNDVRAVPKTFFWLIAFLPLTLEGLLSLRVALIQRKTRR